MRHLELCDGKYTIINDLENGGGFKALRYGNEWRSLAGDNLVLALFYEVEELNQKLEHLDSVLLKTKQVATERITELEKENKELKNELINWHKEFMF
jgi:FtsZ-binding cell division protein ZapB